MVTKSILVEVGFGAGGLFGSGGPEKEKAISLKVFVFVEHGVTGRITVGGGVGEPAGIVTVKFEIVTVCVITTVLSKGSEVTIPEQRGEKVLIPVPAAKNPEGSEISPCWKPKEGRKS